MAIMSRLHREETDEIQTSNDDKKDLVKVKTWSEWAEHWLSERRNYSLGLNKVLSCSWIPLAVTKDEAELPKAKYEQYNHKSKPKKKKLLSQISFLLKFVITIIS